MMPGPRLHRRRLIVTTLAAAAAWLGGMPSFAARGRQTRSLSDANTLAAVCAEFGCTAAIGQTCLAALPASEASTAALSRRLLEGTQLAATAGPSAGALVEMIRARSRNDFRDGRVVTVDGWMLSLTETRVYALAALLQQRHVAAG
jgi:hypothetical protein